LSNPLTIRFIDALLFYTSFPFGLPGQDFGFGFLAAINYTLARPLLRPFNLVFHSEQRLAAQEGANSAFSKYGGARKCLILSDFSYPSPSWPALQLGLILCAGSDPEAAIRKVQSFGFLTCQSDVTAFDPEMAAAAYLLPRDLRRRYMPPVWPLLQQSSSHAGIASARNFTRHCPSGQIVLK
jgi:hypothetical protein